MTTARIRILTIAIACVFCPGLVDSVSAQPQASRTSYTFCLSHPTPPDTSYFSGIFVIDPSVDGDARAWNAENQRIAASGHGGPTPPPWVAQFDQFITQTYPRTSKGAGSCSSFATLAEAQKRMDEVIQGEQNFKYKVVETGWKYTPNPNAAPVASAQPATPARTTSTPNAAAQPPGAVVPGQTLYGFCHATLGGYTQYYSAPFSIPPGKDVWTPAFMDYLKQKYGDERFAVCDTLPSRADAQAGLQRWIDAAHGTRLNDGSTQKYIETGWVYTGPASAPASARPAASRPVDPCVITGIGMATAPPAGCGAPVTSYTVCSSSSAQSTVYISSAFAVTAAAYQSWVNDFTQFLAQKYSYQGGGVACNNMSLNNAPTFLKNRIAALRANKKQVIETGWTYGSAATAGTAAPPTPPAAPVAPAASPAPAAPRPNISAAHVAAAPIAPAPQATSYAVCWAESPARRTAYFGVPFLATKVNNPAWAKEYRDFLDKKYGRVGLISCRTLKSLAEAQQQTQTWMDSARAKDNLVETGWKYQ